MTLEEIAELGFEIEEVVNGAFIVNDVTMDGMDITDLGRMDFDYEQSYIGYDLAESHFDVTLDDTVVLSGVTAQELETFFTSGEFEQLI